MARPHGSTTRADADSFFAFHNLRHYAAECLLGFQQGFYGLIASGWEMADTTGKGSKGRLPDETFALEHLVGLLDAESASGSAASAAEFNEHAAYAAQNNRPAPQPITAGRPGADSFDGVCPAG